MLSCRDVRYITKVDVEMRPGASVDAYAAAVLGALPVLFKRLSLVVGVVASGSSRRFSAINCWYFDTHARIA